MLKKWIALGALLIWAQGLFGQTVATLEPARRITLSASAQIQVPQDVLTLVLQVTRQGYEAATVQSQLKSALDAAWLILQKDALAGQMQVRSGQFGLTPRYDRDGRITAWQGHAEWVLEGTDVARITQAAGRVQGMTIGRLDFGLTPTQRQQAQVKAQAQAIEQFQQRAAEVAKAFGAAGYVLDDVHVGYDDGLRQPGAPMMLARAASDTAAVAVQPGVTVVTVSVAGSVRLR